MEESPQEESQLAPEDYLSTAAWFKQHGKPARVAYILEQLANIKSAENAFYNQLRLESLRGIRLVDINNEITNTKQKIAAQNSTLHYKALLIGINQYHHPAWQRLKNPISDIRAIRQVLINRYDFSSQDILLLDYKQIRFRRLDFEHI